VAPSGQIDEIEADAAKANRALAACSALDFEKDVGQRPKRLMPCRR